MFKNSKDASVRTTFVVILFFVLMLLTQNVIQVVEAAPFRIPHVFRQGRTLVTRNTIVVCHQSVVDTEKDISNRATIDVSHSIILPFPRDIAFDAFRDLTRQPSWSPWLDSVEFIDSNQTETLWKMRYLGLRFSWKSICTLEERPSALHWMSTSGMENFGSVKFEEESKGSTRMTMNMSFAAPSILIRLVGRNGRLQRLAKTQILARTMKNFRDDVLERDVPLAMSELSVLTEAAHGGL